MGEKYETMNKWRKYENGEMLAQRSVMVRIHNPRQPATTKNYFAPLCSATTKKSELEKLEPMNSVPGKIVQMLVALV